jgi:eukaryotic-like serine/threonine-protein kinase
VSPETRTLLRTLTLPFECVKTVYEGGSEVRVYRNEITGQIQVGKRIDILGLDETVAVREAKLLKTIRHPNVVPVDEVARVGGYDEALKVIELIMPFYDRGSVFDALQAGERFSLAEARTLAVESLRGAAEITECHGILHRDHKTPNVLIDDDGHARIGDLGVAVPMEADGTAEAYPNAQLFTPPETFITGRIDRVAEVYQLGLVAFELANGPLPYDDNPIGEVAKRLEKGRRGPRPRDLVAFQPYVPKAMRRVINKAINVDPGERYQTVTQFGDALRGVKLIDWRHIVDDPDRKLWEGAIVKRPDRRYRVEAVLRRNGSWTLSGFQHVSQWRRVVPDQIVLDPLGKDAAGFFDAMLVAATNA